MWQKRESEWRRERGARERLMQEVVVFAEILASFILQCFVSTYLSVCCVYR